MGRLIPLPYQILGTAVLAVVCFLVGQYKGTQRAKEKAEVETALAVTKAAELATEQAKQDVKVVTEYVDRIQRVEVKVPVVRDRLIRVCAAGDSSVSAGTAGADAGATRDADDRRTDQLSADLIACRRIKEQCQGLMDWKKANGG